MATKAIVRKCLACEKPVSGRADKKFCNDYCRNEYNNIQKAETTNLMRNINSALSKNRRVLISFFEDGAETKRVTEDKLLLRGFQFKYHTHTYESKTGNKYFYCYDYGVRHLENDLYLLVKSKVE